MRKLLLLLLCLCLAAPAAASAEEETKYIALTFDDGPSGRHTRQLLEGLAERDARATFFLCGYRMAQYPELTARILEEGHEIGLHGYSHADMSGLSRRDIARELEQTTALLDVPVRFLRPPGGCCSDAVTQVARVRGYAIGLWSLDPRDWATQDSAAVARTILDRVRDGDVILMHDMSESSVSAALNIVSLLQRRGYRFVTMSELARLRNVRPKPGERYRSFPPGA